MEIHQIKAQLSIEAVLRHYGIEINRNKHIKCPFHDDQQASMRVYSDTNTVYCFAGSCKTAGKSLDVIDFIMYREGCNKHEAILKAKAMIGYACLGTRDEMEPVQKVAAPKQIKASTNLTLEEVFSSYQKGFWQTKSAQAYAATRGLDWQKIAIGYNSGQLQHGKSTEFVEDMFALGLLVGTLEARRIWAKQCIIFPLKDSSGRICSLYGRKIAGKGHFYLTGRSGLYPSYPPPETTRIILTESIIDAASLMQISQIADQYFVLALYGTNGLTAEHKAALQELPNLQEVVLMLDGDEAGRKAASQYQSDLQQLFSSNENKSCVVRKVDLPKDSDINDLWVNHSEPQLFLDLLKNAESQTVSNLQAFEVAPKLEIVTPKEEAETSRLEMVNSTLLIWRSESLKIEVLGGVDLSVMESLRATLRITREPKRNALDTLRQSLDLYHNNQLNNLLKKLHEQLELSMQSLRLDLAEFIEELELYRSSERQKTVGKSIRKRVLTKEREKAARAFLMDEKLMESTLERLGKVGVVGEQENAFTMFLCFTSRKMDKPLHVISLGSSGSGKTHLQEVIAGLMPEEEIVSVTSLSDNALYYYGQQKLKNVLYLVEDMDGLSEDALLALRELMSKGFVIRNIPLKESSNGRPQTVEILVEGPICFAGCTTRERLYEDNANRSLLLYRDESVEHRAAVMAAQRKAAAGKVNEAAQVVIRELFKDCQMLLKPIKVVNPYAEQLDLPEKVFKPLRTNAHYLKFIEVVTFYHQLQREQKRDAMGNAYIETTLEDIAWANKLMKDILLAKTDELCWPSRQFLECLEKWLEQQGKTSFKSQEIRTALRLHPSSLKRRLYDLQAFGYLRTVGGSPYKGFEYELICKGSSKNLKIEVESVLDRCLSSIKDKQK